ncbi:unnamed protein product, partial [Protopolystoma xenopodis]
MLFLAKAVNLTLHQMILYPFILQGGDREILSAILAQEKEANPDRIPYFLSTLKEPPGYFLLAFMPNRRAHFDSFSIRPEGFRYRDYIFPTLDRMIAYFKEHYNDQAS